MPKTVTQLNNTLKRHAGLYYPFIHFADEEWLKMNVLYWDWMGRIVPESYLPDDSETVKELIATPNEFVVDLTPTAEQLTVVAQHFLNLVWNNAERLRERYALRSSDGPAINLDDLPTRMSVIGSKMFDSLREALEDSGLAVTVPEARTGAQRVYMHPLLARVYMAALADEMASGALCQPVSKDGMDHLAVSGLTVERLSQVLLDITRPQANSLEIEAQMAVVTFRMIFPRGLKDVPVAKLIAFRREHRDELNAYQDFVRALSQQPGPLGDLQAVKDPRALGRHLKSEYDRTIAPSVSSLRAALLGMGVQTVEAAASVRLPQSIPLEHTATAVGLAVAPQAFAAGALGWLTFKVLRSRRAEARKAISGAPAAAYLMYAQEEFTPHSLLEDIAIKARRFAVGA